MAKTANQDVLTLLRDDHRTVEELFARFEEAGPRAAKTKQGVVERIIQELAVHAAVEELVFYPTVREWVPDLEDNVLEGLEEHHIVKWTLSELEHLTPDDERFDAKVTVLIESVRHHVKEEERDIFPSVRQAFSLEERRQLGGQVAEAKRVVPTRPHPTSPDTPPGNLIAGAVAGPIDRAVDAGRRALRAIGR